MSGADAGPRRPVGRRGRSIAWPIFALAVVSVLVATAIFFAITFNGPPPKAPPRGLESIAHVLRTGTQPGDPGPALPVTLSAESPAPRAGERARPDIAARLARSLGVSPADVVAFARPQPRDLPGAFVDGFQFARRTPTGWRIVRNNRQPLLTRWHWVTLAAMLAAILALAVPAWLIARAISRPLRGLADAALAARAGAPLANLPHTGAGEVRDLARAVATMHDRLQRHAEGRTVMLGAIAHDLGTPLSRLAFRIEALPEAARARAAADIDEMRAMIAATLAFARDEGARVEHDRLDLGSLLDALAEDIRAAGAPVMLTPGGRTVVRGDSLALRRLFGNLIENAVRYGGSAEIGWHEEGGDAVVLIEDRGPGPGDGDPERLFDPFVRGERSRNRATGGTGLGLAIVRTIATRHGGGATLTARPGGGARATVTLPLA